MQRLESLVPLTTRQRRMYRKFLLTAMPVPFDEIQWFPGNTGVGKRGPWIKLMAYLDARQVMDRFDRVWGEENWTNEYKQVLGGFCAGIGVRDDIESPFIWKWDGAPESDIEAIKGGYSGALKRAAVLFGFDRSLYHMGDTWANISDSGKMSCKINGDWVKYSPPTPADVIRTRTRIAPAPVLLKFLDELDWYRAKVEAVYGKYAESWTNEDYPKLMELLDEHKKGDAHGKTEVG